MRHSEGLSAPLRNIILIALPASLALGWAAGCLAAPGTPQTVTATKTVDATGTNVTTASFTIAQSQSIVWDATYTGSPTQGHSFYLTQNALSNMADIFLTNGGGHGTKFLASGTYYISIKTALMGPGAYTVKFDPTGDGSKNGDPHITTVNGVHYDFQAAGEFVALRGDQGMEIQTRQEPVSSAGGLTDPYSGLTTGVAINTAIAVRAGGRRVSLQFDRGSQSADSRLRVRIDGQERQVRAPLLLGPTSSVSAVEGGSIRVDFPDGTIMLATPQWWAPMHRWYLDLSVRRTPAHAGTMGIIAGRDWLPRLPDGTRMGPRPLAVRDRYRQLYGRFADAWRVAPQASLFDYAQGESAVTFARRDWPRLRGPFLVPGSQAVPMAPVRVALAACRGVRDTARRRNCMFDVRIMGDPGVGKNYVRLERALGSLEPALEGRLPTRQ